MPSSLSRQASPVLATSPPAPQSPIKVPPRAPQLLTPASASPHPSRELNQAAPPCPSSTPVSSYLPSLVAYSQIDIALKLHHCATSIAHTPSSPIAPGSPTGDLATAGARHLTADWPFQGPTGQIDPTSVTPYLRPCYATIPSIQNRTTGKEPPSGSMVTAGSHRREWTTLLPP
jgi:hypothetical protein